MRKASIAVTFIAAIFLAAATALAAGTVDLKIKTEKEETLTKNGKTVTRVIPAKKFAPGDVIIYTITYTNTTGEVVKNAVVDDPIPAGTLFIPNSATGEGADVSFSIDKGKTYNKPTMLYYQVEVKGKKEQKVATPDQYTNIRWTVPSIPVKGTGKVSFKVRVK